MKRLKQMFLLTMLAVFILGIAVPVYAKTEVRTETLYPTKDKDYFGNGKNEVVFIGYEKKNQYTDVKVKNKSIVNAITFKKMKGYGTMKSFVWDLKKPGRTEISYKEKFEGDKKAKAQKIDLRVKKYVNPIASIKLGNRTIKGSKFNTTSVYKVKYSDFKNRNVKVKITPAKGWSVKKEALSAEAKELLKKAEKASKKGDYEKDLELQEKAYALSRKSSFAYLPAKLHYFMVPVYRSTLNSQNGSSVKVNGGKGSEIMIYLINNKTKQEETIEIRFE